MIRSGSSFSRSMLSRNTIVPTTGGFGTGCGRRRQVEHVGVDEDPLLRQVHDQVAVSVRQTLDQVHLEGARGVLEHALVAGDAFDLQLLAGLRHGVRRQRARRAQRALEERLVGLVASRW